jgi:hypothetical protein
VFTIKKRKRKTTKRSSINIYNRTSICIIKPKCIKLKTTKKKTIPSINKSNKRTTAGTNVDLTSAFNASKSAISARH